MPQQIDSINTEESCWVQNLRNFPRIARIKADLNNATNSPTEIEIVFNEFRFNVRMRQVWHSPFKSYTFSRVYCLVLKPQYLASVIRFIYNQIRAESKSYNKG